MCIYQLVANNDNFIIRHKTKTNKTLKHRKLKTRKIDNIKQGNKHFPLPSVFFYFTNVVSQICSPAQ